MKSIHRATLETCATATGIVVPIDVLRAFTTAAFLFDAGVEETTLVSTVEEALALKQADPALILVGEERGLPIAGFDFGNSPTAIAGLDLHGRRAVQRTSAGTQGVVRSVNADEIWLGSLVVASATLRQIQRSRFDQVTLVPTEYFPHEPDLTQGAEDVACADLLESWLTGQPVRREDVQARVRSSRSAQKFNDTHPAFPASDLKLALEIDRFDFAMRAERQNGRFVAHVVK